MLPRCGASRVLRSVCWLSGWLAGPRLTARSPQGQAPLPAAGTEAGTAGTAQTYRVKKEGAYGGYRLVTEVRRDRRTMRCCLGSRARATWTARIASAHLCLRRDAHQRPPPTPSARRCWTAASLGKSCWSCDARGRLTVTATDGSALRRILPARLRRAAADANSTLCMIQHESVFRDAALLH